MKDEKIIGEVNFVIKENGEDSSLVESEKIETQEEIVREIINEAPIIETAELNERPHTWDQPKEKRPTRKKNRDAWTRFLVAIVIMSLVGGGAAGVGYYIAESYFKGNPVGLSTNYFQSNTELNSIMEISAFYDGTEKSIVAISEEVGSSIVGITTKVSYRDWFNNIKTSEGAGSGIIFKKDAEAIYILTNNHVVDEADELLVEFYEDRLVKAILVGTDEATDIGIIKVPIANLDEGMNEKIKPVVFGNSDGIKVGETAIAIGNPLGYKNTITVGVISALDRKIDTANILSLIQTDAAINPGNSGGALVNTRGEVIGMNTIKISDTQVEGIGFALPINEVKPIIDDLITYGYVSKPVLGIAGRDIDEELSELYDLPIGIVIMGVYKDSSAESVGIKRGDVIVAINDRHMNSIRDLSEYLSSFDVGETVKVKIVRDGDQKIEYEIELIDKRQLKEFIK